MYRCPNCQQDDQLKIYASIGCGINVSAEEEILDCSYGDIDWSEEDDVVCFSCDWEGTVKEIMVNEPVTKEAQP